jgi:hypothetical protein
LLFGRLIFVYYLITEPYKKEFARTLLHLELRDNVSYFQDSLERINSFLVLTKSPVNVAIGYRLKDELRETIELLNSIKLR